MPGSYAAPACGGVSGNPVCRCGCVFTAILGRAVSGLLLGVASIGGVAFLCSPGGVVLFVFRLDALVVRLEGIAVCGYCGVYALHRSVCFLVVFARCCMSMQALLVGKPEWFKFCQVVCPRSQNPDRCI